MIGPQLLFKRCKGLPMLPCKENIQTSKPNNRCSTCYKLINSPMIRMKILKSGITIKH